MSSVAVILRVIFGAGVWPTMYVWRHQTVNKLAEIPLYTESALQVISNEFITFAIDFVTFVLEFIHNKIGSYSKHKNKM